MGYSFYELLSIFAFYSTLGFIIEQTMFGTLGGKLVKRGLLVGPYCPIYGFDALLITQNLMLYKGNILFIAFGSLVVFAGMRILTGAILKGITGVKFWVSDWIVPMEAIAGAGLGVVVVYVIEPILIKVIAIMPWYILMVLLLLFYGFMVSQTIDLLFLLFGYKLKMENISNTRSDDYEYYARRVAEELRDYGSLLRRFKNFRRRTIKSIFKDKNHDEIALIKFYMRENGE